MKRRTSLGATLLLGVILSSQAWAQGPYAPSEMAALRGAKVRLHTYRGTLQGIVEGVQPDGEILLRRSSWQTEKLPVEGILQVDVYSRDRGSTIAGMTLGGGLGLGLGVGIASWLESVDEENGPGPSAMVLLGGLGALVGATVGGHLMGAVWTPFSPGVVQWGMAPHATPLAVSCAWSF